MTHSPSPRQRRALALSLALRGEGRGRRRFRLAVAVRSLLFLIALMGVAVCATARAEDAGHAPVGDNPAFESPMGVEPAHSSAEPPRTYAPVRPARPEEVERQFKRDQNSAFSRWSGAARPNPSAVGVGTRTNSPSPSTVLRVGTGKAAGRSGGGAESVEPGASGSSLSLAPPQL